MKTSFLEWLDDKIIEFSKSDLRHYLVNIPKYPKRAILMVTDFLVISFALWMSFSLRFNHYYLPPNWDFFLILLIAPVLGISVFFLLGVYKSVTRFIVAADIIRLYFASFITVITWTFISFSLNSFTQHFYGVLPRSIPVSFLFMTVFLVWLVRAVAAMLLRGQEHVIHSSQTAIKPIIIYGAGVTGVQLAETLTQERSFDVRAFIDDNPSLWKRRVGGHKIYSADHIAALIKNDNVKEVILAVPSANLSERKRILRFLEPYPVAVRTLPAVGDIVSGRVSVGDLKLVGVEDLLGRDPVPPNKKLFERVIFDKSVLITGAGGSIGSELSRQILQGKPKRIILFDVSEVALYLIEQVLTEILGKIMQQDEATQKAYENIEIIPLLGSVLDQSRLSRIMSDYGVQVIFHAAAYKHVPLVEANPFVGIYNNLWGTKCVADMALKAGVERFVLISTDKAVRPTNVMGASKRLAEMYLQALSAQNNGTEATIFTMVRFGNVLDSSGSVVQKFRQQITNGGPVTVTHPEIVRFFMSIPEAAELVIQAGAMAKGGEVYVLDMGEPVKILDLAATMIRLMGLEVRNDGNPNGDIDINFSGLRPGEKLYEETLIEQNSRPTKHARIQKNKEPFIEMDALKTSFDELETAITNYDHKTLFRLLKKLVTGYKQDKNGQKKS